MPAAHDSRNQTSGTGLSQSSSPAPLIAQLLDLFPVKSSPPWILLCQLSSPFTHTPECCLHLILVGVSSVGHKPCHSPAVPRNDDFLSLLDPIEQSPKRILGLKSSYLLSRRR
jgi:hypothetical protein